MNIAVIGCGYWGNHILRNFHSSELWNLKIACDRDEKQLAKAKAQFQYIEITNDAEIIFADNSIDAVAIATPVESHYILAKKALEAGKHVWVEKPLTSNSAQAQELVELANSKNLILNVDHTFLHTPSVKKIKELIDKNDLGDIHYIDSVRINLGLFQHDVNVIWDLAPHDIAILSYCLGKSPVSVNATGKSLVKYSSENLENIAYISLNYADGSIAHLHVNWMSPVKIRQMIFGGSKKMLVFDDMQNSEKIKVYDSGVTVQSREDVYSALVQYRTGDMFSPAISSKEALQEEVIHFYNCIKSNSKPITSGELGLEVVKILESANLSLKENGKEIFL